MTKKKRELIEILLDNVKPEDWPENLPYAAQDKSNGDVWAYSSLPVMSGLIYGQYSSDGNDAGCILEKAIMCRNWHKTIVHRDEFMKRWNERNPVVDSEGWIKWNGGEMPVEKGTLIDVKYRDGVFNLYVKAGEHAFGGSISERCAIDFKHDDDPGDIIAYRLHQTQKQKTQQQLALEKFGTDWHDNEGVQPVDDDVLIDVMFFNETKSYQANPASIWGWSVENKTSLNIKKWRIHSDEKESQAELAANQLAFDDGPMVSEPVRKSPLSTQIGGDHYTKLAIQPMRYSMENKLDPLQHTIIKYVTRFRDKNGIEDLEKAKHCIDMLIEFEKRWNERNSVVEAKTPEGLKEKTK